MRIGLIYSRIREDEKLILQEMRDRGHEVVKIDIRDQLFSIGELTELLADLDLVYLLAHRWPLEAANHAEGPIGC